MLLLGRWMVPLFSILIDESYDISIKEQMAVVLCIWITMYEVESFVGIDMFLVLQLANLIICFQGLD